MRIVLIAVALMLSAFVAPLDGAAQAADTVYVVQPRSAFLSGFLEYLVPTVGYAYAGDWKRGLLPNAVRVGGVIAAWDYLIDGEEECDGGCTVGVVAALGGTVWAVVGAVLTAKERRTLLEPPGSGFTLAPSPMGGVDMGIRWVR